MYNEPSFEKMWAIMKKVANIIRIIGKKTLDLGMMNAELKVRTRYCQNPSTRRISNGDNICGSDGMQNYNATRTSDGAQKSWAVRIPKSGNV